jgi:hypothetical protein
VRLIARPGSPREGTGPLPKPNAADRGSVYTWAWLAWIAVFFVVEFKALHDDSASPDRVKRTLSSSIRWWAATDSVTGIPVDARYGKLRRLALICALAWFGKHIERNGVV